MTKHFNHSARPLGFFSAVTIFITAVSLTAAPQPERGAAATIIKPRPAHKLSQAAYRQIELPAKRTKVRDNRRLGPHLRQALELAETKGAAAALDSLRSSGAVPDSGSENVPVVVRAIQPGQLNDLKRQLSIGGARFHHAGMNTLKMSMPLTQLRNAASLSQIRSIRALRPPRKKAYVGEGVSATHADIWHSLGFTGSGVKVAVVDTGFTALAALVSDGELPSDYVAVNFSSAPDIGDTDAHGSACAEIVYDIAPDAELHLIKVDDISDVSAVAEYCATAGVNIVSFSLGFDVINFHDGIAYPNPYTDISDHPVTAVNSMREAGTLVAIAAGNEQLQHTLINWGSSDEVLLWDSQGTEFNDLYYDYNTAEFPAGAYISVLMSWNRWPVTDEDYDLYLYHYNENTRMWDDVASSTWYQNGDAYSYPTEELEYITEQSGYYAALVHHYNSGSSSTQPEFILRYYGVVYPYYWQYNNASNPAPGSISIPGDAEAALTVGAVDFINYPDGPVDYYSSLGPNNRAFTGGTAAIKPDLCAPAGATSVVYNTSFSGTSAATPHVAGLAALVKGVYPFFTADQIESYLEKFCFDIAPPGKENTNGAGSTQLPTLLTVIEGEAMRATAVAQSGDTALLEFTGLADEHYSVEACDSLLSPSWQVLGTVTTASNGTAAFIDPGPLPAQRFYRLVK